MKTFFNLVQEVQKKGLCTRCGGCATFCKAINYGALEIDKSGKPAYGDMEKCIECGLCYSICPEIKDLDEAAKQKAAWSEPMGRVIETTVVRSTDSSVRSPAINGGAVTGILHHLFDKGKIDGAIISKPVGKFQRQPFLATKSEEVVSSAGLFFDTSYGMKPFSEQHITFSAIKEFDPMIKKRLNRVAFVGTPCQIKSVRKMQTLNLAPADSIKICLGIFCSGIFTFGDSEREQLGNLAGISMEDAVGINLKDKLIITLKSGEEKTIELEQMESMKRYACHYCSDYSAEFADISFGGIGADKGWTTAIARTPLGRAILSDARSLNSIEQFKVEDKAGFASSALQEVRKASAAKKKKARFRRRELQDKSVKVRI